MKISLVELTMRWNPIGHFQALELIAHQSSHSHRVERPPEMHAPSIWASVPNPPKLDN
jgi:hypothetical protein